MSRINRRGFLKGTLGTAAAISLPSIAVDGAILGANERLRMAVCGLNGRGGSHIGGFGGDKRVELAWLIDPDENVLKRRLRGRKNCQGSANFRKALADKNVDAISVAAPNHWHSLMTIEAAQAGKHCYVEKPASHDVYEGAVATAAWKKYKVVIQHGTQQRSDARVAGLHDLIHKGKFGKLKISYGYCCKPRGGIGKNRAGEPPKHLDWDLWKGPAKVKEYHSNYVHYNWHWFWDTGNGDLNNQGTHQLDRARWAIDKDQTHPVRTFALGGRFNNKQNQWNNDEGETPNSMFAAAEYPNGQWVFFNVRNVNYKGYPRQVENEYYFEDGGRIIRDRYYPKGSNNAEKIDIPAGKVTPGGNWRSFISACIAGDQMMANGNMEEAHYGCVLGHIMNNSYRIGKEAPFNEKAGKYGDNKDVHEHFMKLHSIMRDGCGVPENKAKYIVGPELAFDPKTEMFTGENSEEANKLLRDPNRKGFEVPDIAKV